MIWNGRPYFDLSADAFRELERLQRTFGDFFRTTGLSNIDLGPAVNVWSNDDEVVVTAEVPGVDAKISRSR